MSISDADTATEPDWDTPVSLSITPASIIHTLFATAESVHTGWETCVDSSLIVSELTALDDLSDNYCRLVEQEYLDEEASEVTWHDWSVEIRIGSTLVSAHWRAQLSAAPFDWDWCQRQAEDAFSRACLLVGKPVRRTLAVEQVVAPNPGSRTHH